MSNRVFAGSADRLQKSSRGGDEGLDAGRKGKVGRGFEGEGVAGAVLKEPEGFGPQGTRERIDVGMNESAVGGAVFDDGREIDGADGGDLLDGFSRLRGTPVGIQFVEVEAVRFPVFVQTQREVEIRLALEPGDVGTGLRCFSVEILAVEVEALGV